MSDTNEHRKVPSDLMSDNPSENRVQSSTKKPRLNPDSVTSAPPAVPAAEEPTEEPTDWRKVTVTLAAANKTAAEAARTKAQEAFEKAKAELEQAEEAAKGDAEEDLQVKKSSFDEADAKAEEAKITLAEVNSAVNSLRNSGKPDGKDQRYQIDRFLFLTFCDILKVTKESLQRHLRIPEDADHPEHEREIQSWINTLDSIDNVEAKFRDFYKNKWRNALIQAKRYFHTIDEVIDAKGETYSDSRANPFQRGRPPQDWNEYKNMNVKDNEFMAQFMQAELAHFNLDEKTSRSFGLSETKNRIWPCDIFGRELETGAEVANLIPHSLKNALEWVDVACWAFGLDPEQTTWEMGLRLLNGVKNTNGTKRKQGSGIRNFQVNRLRINGQKTLIDGNDPSVLIIPIRTFEQCRDWNGDEYDAIVFAQDEDAFYSLGAYDSNNQNDATLYEVQTAIDLLRECTREMAKSTTIKLQVGDRCGPIEKATLLEAKGTRETFAGTFNGPTSISENEKTFPLPKLIDNGRNLDLDYRGVCKVTFSHARDRVRTQNPAPDPLLLVAKASVVWSVMKDVRLREGAGPPDDDDSSDDSDDLDWVLLPLPADYSLPSPLKEQRDSVPESITAVTLLSSVGALEPNCHDNDTSSISSSSFTE